MFVMQYIDSDLDTIVNERSLGWIMNVLGTIPEIGYYNSYLNDFYELLCHHHHICRPGRPAARSCATMIWPRP